jgi:hypothetical protein
MTRQKQNILAKKIGVKRCKSGRMIAIVSREPANASSCTIITAGESSFPSICARHSRIFPVLFLIEVKRDNCFSAQRRTVMKIGLLAMSGVRAHDAKLLELGLTLPGFVERSKVIASLPSLGLLYLAAVTPAGHTIVYFEAEADGAEPAEVYECDLVAISTFSAQVAEAYAIADRLRQAGV